MPFFGPENVVFIVKKVSFLSRTLLYLVSSLILTEKKIMKNLAFLSKSKG